MTRKTIGYTHLQWTCPACGHKNAGTAEKCASCQAPQPEDIAFEQPAQEKLIQDDKTIARAKAGPDIHCPYCGTRNLANATSCTQCGGDLAEGAAREKGSALGAHRRQATPNVACAYCGTTNSDDAHSCSNCGASLAKSEPKRPSPQPTTAPAQPGKNISPLLIGLLVFGCIAALVLVVLFNRTEDVIGQVESVQWERTITIEQLSPVSREDWLDDIPADANIGVCTDKPHHTQNSPAANSTEICGTPYTLDTGTGIGEVVQDCEYQIYEDWCEYTALEWQTADSVSTQGNNYNPNWPQYTLRTNQREGGRQENYHILFDTDGNNYNYSTSSLDRFADFQIGSDWVLEVNTFDMIVGVEPAP